MPYLPQYILSLPELGVPYLVEVELVEERHASRHDHREVQLLFPLDGEIDLEIADRRHRLSRGTACRLPANVPHIVTTGGAGQRARLLDLRFSAEAVSPFIRFLDFFKDRVVLSADAREVVAVAEQFALVNRLHGLARIGKLMTQIWRLLGQLRIGEDATPLSEGDRRLLSAERLMRDRISQPLDVSAIAESVGLSRSQLSRLFMRHLGVSPARHLRQLRMDRARQLLESSTLSVKEVAHACGFVCANHFNRIFHQHTGRTPGRFRRGEEE